MLCLVAAGIISYKVVINEKEIKHVLFNWRVTSGERHAYAYKNDANWDGIPLAAVCAGEGAAAGATGAAV